MKLISTKTSGVENLTSDFLVKNSKLNNIRLKNLGIFFQNVVSLFIIIDFEILADNNTWALTISVAMLSCIYNQFDYMGLQRVAMNSSFIKKIVKFMGAQCLFSFF